MRPRGGDNVESRFEITPVRLREYRKSLRENQTQFWSRFGVTQSRGSRFEMGVEIPSPVVILLRLYWEGKISDLDLAKTLHYE